MTALVVVLWVDGAVACLVAVSVGLLDWRVHRTARERPYDAAAGTDPLRGPR